MTEPYSIMQLLIATAFSPWIKGQKLTLAKSTRCGIFDGIKEARKRKGKIQIDFND